MYMQLADIYQGWQEQTLKEGQSSTSFSGKTGHAYAKQMQHLLTFY